MDKKLKVYGQTMSGSFNEVSTIILKGRWLEKAGFKIGEYVEIKAENDTITITHTDPPEKELTLQERIESLSPQEKKKLGKIIEGMERK